MLTLVDSSTWISHLHRANTRLIALLETKQVLIHSAVLGELAIGTIRNRARVLGDLKQIPRIPEVPAEEILEFIEIRKLHGRGLSWVDTQLLASCVASSRDLMTEDHRLRLAFEKLK